MERTHRQKGQGDHLGTYETRVFPREPHRRETEDLLPLKFSSPTLTNYLDHTSHPANPLISMDPQLAMPDILLLLQRQTESLNHAISALSGNASESWKTITFLQQENARLTESICTRETRAPQNNDNPRDTAPTQRDSPQRESSTTPTIPLIHRIGSRAPFIERPSPIEFPSISDVPIIREPSTPVLDPPPPHLPPDSRFRQRTGGRGPFFEGEGVKHECTTFASSASQWRQHDKNKRTNLKAVRRNEQGELDIGDLYTYAFIMRAFHGQVTRKNTPRVIKKISTPMRNWGLVESAFFRAVAEVVLEPGLVYALKAIRTTIVSETKNPGSYLTDAITETREFPPNLAAELLVQKGATRQWFEHRWTISYMKSYLSEWGVRNYTKLPESQTADLFCYIFSPISHEHDHPFSSIPTVIIAEDENAAHYSLADNLLDIVPSWPDQTNLRPTEDTNWIEVNMDAEDPEERTIW